MHSKPTTEIVENLESVQTGRFWFYGGRTFLQHRVLSEAREQLREDGTPVVLLAPSTGEDASHVAMLETTAQLKEQDHSSKEFDAIVDESLPWHEKMEAFSAGLKSLNGGTTFLLWAPSAWGAGEEDSFYWNFKTDQVCNALFTHAPKVLYTGYHMRALPYAEKHSLKTEFNWKTFLSKHFQNGPLSSAASSLLDTIETSKDLHELQVRLMVALVHTTNDPDISPKSIFHLIEELSNVLQSDSWTALRNAWYIWSLVRRPFEWQALSSMLTDSLRDDEKSILSQCLMQKSPDERYEVILTPKCGTDESREDQCHEKCLSLYKERMASAKETDNWRYGLEAAHHASKACDWDYLKEHRPLFGDHYNLYGKRASLQAQATEDEETFELAAHFFEQTLEIDDQDDYAHHYLAYNLDYAALDEKKSYNHYQRAIKIAPERSWWHSRYITFLVTTGKLEEAHEAWDKAQDDLLEIKTQEKEGVFKGCHRWILRLLLHRSHLDFACEVLEDIPESERDDIPGIRLMEGMLQSMRDAEEGIDVYPMDVPLKDRWRPRLLTSEDTKHELSRWFAGKVEYKTDNAVGILLAEKDDMTEEVRYFRSELSLSQFEELSEKKLSAVSEGDYFELYSFCASNENHAEHKVIRYASRDPRSTFDELPPLKPDPKRYLKREGYVVG